MKVQYFLLYMGIILIFLGTSCEKFLDVGAPPDKVVAKTAFSTDISSVAVVTGIYTQLYRFTTGTGTFFHCGLSADEFQLYSQDNYSFSEFYKNGSVGSDFWGSLYGYIYKINAAIEGISNSSTLSDLVRKQLLGELKFQRSFCYFYLVNLYGDVPVVLRSDYKENAQKSRMPIADVYNQIISDLIESQGLLNENYVGADVISNSVERVRPNRGAALTLLARAYLYVDDWSKANETATLVINNRQLYDTVSLGEVFLKNNREAIWQLQPVDATGNNTQDAKLYILTKGPDGRHPVTVSANLLASFESGDMRKEKWIGKDSTVGVYYYPFKYKAYRNEDPSIEYQTIIRLAEVYLIRAEAKAKMGDFLGAKSDLNLIRHRAGLSNINVYSKEELLEALLKERFVELFTEGGHRWLDLKRTGKIDDIMKIASPLKGGIWETYKKMYPLPITDLRLNTNLVQNSGYPSI